MDDVRKIGIGLTAVGLVFTMLGVLLIFDRTLLTMGNLLFLAGVPMIIGVQKTGKFFFQRRKLRGTACFLSGVLLVFVGWPFFGIIIEAFGFLNLFGDFFPVVLAFLRNMPVIGSFLQMPFVRAVTDRLVTKSRLPV